MVDLFERDERQASIDQRADRLAYLVLSYGLLAIVACRGFVERTASFELLALVIVAGVAGALYRARSGTFTRGVLVMLGVTIATALVVAAIIATVQRP